MAVGLQLATKNSFVRVQEDINDNLTKLDEAIDFNLLATLGIEYGGILNNTNAKTSGKAYYDTTGKKLYKCIANTSISYADAGFFEAISNNDLLEASKTEHWEERGIFPFFGIVRVGKMVAVTCDAGFVFAGKTGIIPGFVIPAEFRPAHNIPLFAVDAVLGSSTTRREVRFDITTNGEIEILANSTINPVYFTAAWVTK